MEELNSDKSSNAVKSILLTGLLAGTLDISAAFINAFISNGTPPIRVLQYIAGGVLGKNAFEGGLPIAGLGLIFHYLIAFSWTVLFFFLYPKIKLFAINPIFTGIVYGLIIWLVMNLIVLPLTNVPKPPFSINLQTFINIGILMLCVGLPISILASKHYALNRRD